jgi:hypothetical protein
MVSLELAQRGGRPPKAAESLWRELERLATDLGRAGAWVEAAPASFWAGLAARPPEARAELASLVRETMSVREEIEQATHGDKLEPREDLRDIGWSIYALEAPAGIRARLVALSRSLPPPRATGGYESLPEAGRTSLAVSAPTWVEGADQLPRWEEAWTHAWEPLIARIPKRDWRDRNYYTQEVRRELQAQDRAIQQLKEIKPDEVMAPLLMRKYGADGSGGTRLPDDGDEDYEGDAKPAEMPSVARLKFVIAEHDARLTQLRAGIRALIPPDSPIN